MIVPPFEALWVRMTVIADPQGATFIASKFVPENKDLRSEAAEAGKGLGAVTSEPPPARSAGLHGKQYSV